MALGITPDAQLNTFTTAVIKCGVLMPNDTHAQVNVKKIIAHLFVVHEQLYELA